MTSPEVLQRTFPGMEGMTPSIPFREEDQPELNMLFNDLTDIFRPHADVELVGLDEDLQTNKKRLVLYDTVQDQEVIALWDLGERGTTTSKGEVFVNRADYPEHNVVYYGEVRLKAGIYPKSRRFDEHGMSVSQNRMFESLKKAVEGLKNSDAASPSNGLLLLGELKAGEIMFIPGQE